MQDTGAAETIRAFIAVTVPEAVVRVLTAVQRGIQTDARANSIRWCKPSQFHLTLAFLGDLEASRRAEQLFRRFKADEASQMITAKRRMISPEDNNERQAIHEHESVPLR